MINRFVFVTVTFAMMLALLISGVDMFGAGAITVVAMTVLYVIMAYVRGKSRRDLLEVNCDPQAFLKRTEEQRYIMGRNPRAREYLSIDEAAAFISMGEFEKAKSVLDLVDESKLSAKNGTLLAYTINLMLCLYELGEISRAEEIFETQMPLLAPVSPALALAVKSLVAGRFFFLSRYEESRMQLNELLKEKTSKRVRLYTLYYLALIDEKTGDAQEAKKKYHEVGSSGNKLWIAGEARKKIELLP